MVMEKALSREGSAGCWRESRIYPPLALEVGVSSADAELNCACTACASSRKERMPEHKLRRNMMVRPYGKDVASISSTPFVYRDAWFVFSSRNYSSVKEQLDRVAGRFSASEMIRAYY